VVVVKKPDANGPQNPIIIRPDLTAIKIFRFGGILFM